MNILIVGCGRVGRRLVHVLERLGHDVSVLDEDAANLALLNELEPPFSGMAVAGVPIDGDVLRSAGTSSPAWPSPPAKRSTPSALACASCAAPI